MSAPREILGGTAPVEGPRHQDLFSSASALGQRLILTLASSWTDDRVCQTASETPFSQALIYRDRHAGLGIESDRGGRPSEDRLQGSRTHKDPRSSRLGATPPPRVAIYLSNFGPAIDRNSTQSDSSSRCKSRSHVLFGSTGLTLIPDTFGETGPRRVSRCAAAGLTPPLPVRLADGRRTINEQGIPIPAERSRLVFPVRNLGRTWCRGNIHGYSRKTKTWRSDGTAFPERGPDVVGPGLSAWMHTGILS